MLYSKSTGGFYLPEVHGDYIPSDAVEVTDEAHAALLDGQSQGKRIVAGPDGLPMLADQPLPTHAELVEVTLTTARQIRLPIIGILDGMQSSDLTNGDLEGAQVIEVAKTGLKNITKVDLSSCTTAEEMQSLILMAYVAIAKAAPVTVQTAFAQVLA